MEGGTFGVPIDMANRNPVILDGIPSHTTSHSLVQLDSFDLNIQNQVMVGFPILSTLQGESMNDLNGELNMTNHYSLRHSNPLDMPLDRNVVTDASFSYLDHVNDTEFQKRFAEGTSISSTSLATLLATRNNLPENLNKLAISAPSMMPLDVSSNYVSNDCSDASNSSFANSVNHGGGYDEVLGSMNSEWNFNKFSDPPELGGKTQASTGVQSFLSMGNLDANGWIPSNCANLSTAFCKELSLSLATSQPSVISGQNVPDQCSEVSCSAVTNNCLDKTRFVTEQQTSCNSKELSLSVGSCQPAEFSPIISGSGYLPIIQEVLAQIASYSLENLGHSSYASGGIGGKYCSNCPAERGMLLVGSDEYPYSSGRIEFQMDPAMQRWAIEAKKTQLLALLQVVDDRYNQCLDEIHTIISAFHAVTELNPQIHVQFALHTISFFYKNLRERISNQILAMGAYNNSGCTREEERSLENSFFPNQWALQHQKRKEQLWRPQRGLPERSVSVLRAWMFQNFLHPYPKDSEKHLLAVKSGLTRSQVSNWFINARVRLWKPMIEEMYSDMNRRKGHQNQEGTNNSSHTSQMGINKQIFNTR